MHIQRAAVGPGQRFDDRQSQAEAFLRSVGVGRNFDKRVGDGGYLFRRDADAGVADRQGVSRVRCRGGNRYLAVLRREFEGIGKKVKDDFLDRLIVGIYRRDGFRQVDGDVDGRGLSLQFHDTEAGFDDRQ
ncbi:MAG: hypothetical protein VW268_13085 [Rhodospirillaceae bacterium]